MTAIESLAARVSAGEGVSTRDAQLILETPDLITVGVISDEVRRRMHGPRTTFVRVFEIHIDAIPAVLPPRCSAGELRIVGVPSSIEGAVSAVRAAAVISAGAVVSGFSVMDLQLLGTGRDALRETCGRLRDAGLECVAELPIDLVEEPESVVSDIRLAGLAVRVLTVNSLDADQQIAVAQRARDLQAVVGGLHAFAPLARKRSAAMPSTGYDDVKQVAVARLVAANIPSIQVDWVLDGPKLAQVALTMGADDVDRVAAVDPGVLGTRRSPIEEIRRNISAAALVPVERDGRFEALPAP